MQRNEEVCFFHTRRKCQRRSQGFERDVGSQGKSEWGAEAPPPPAAQQALSFEILFKYFNLLIEFLTLLNFYIAVVSLPAV